MRSIALLVDGRKIKRQLKRFLSGSYTLMRGRSASHIPIRPFDLVIVDLSALQRLKQLIEVRRQQLSPIMLPVLLVASSQDLDNPSIDKLSSTFDEVILTPLDENELAIRLRNLFEAQVRTRQVDLSYHALSLTSLAGVVILQGRRVAFANQALADMVGIKLDEFHALTPAQVRRLVHPDDRRAVFRKMFEVYKGQKHQFHTEFRYRQRDGELRWVEMLASRIEYHGNPALQATAIDITSRKRAAIELQQRESALKKAQAVSHTGSWVWDVKTNQLEWSDEMYKIFGIDKQSFSGNLEKVVQTAIHPDDREAVNASNLSVVEDKNPGALEYRIVRPDGSIRTVWAEAGELIVDSDGQSSFLTGIVQDISERKRVERALFQSQRRLQSLYDSMMEGVSLHELVFDSDGKVCNYRLVDVNPKFEEILNLKRDEVVGRLATEVYQLDEAPFLDVYARVATGGKAHQFEAYIEPMDKHFSISVFSPGENQFATIFSDVTARIKMEEALRHSEERYRLLAETTPDLIIMHDVDGRISYINQACKYQLGYEEEELLGKNISDFIPSEYLNGIDDRKELRLGGELGAFHYELELIDRQGMRLPVDVRSTPIIQQDEVQGILVVARDITERKQVEEALRESEELYRLLTETTPDIIILQDHDGRIIYINEAGLRYTGYKRDELIDELVIDFVPREYHKAIWTMREQRVQGDRQPYHFEMELINKANQRIPLDVRTTPIFKDDAMPQILIVARDITERKQAEQELRRSQNLLNKSQAIAQVGSWELDLITNQLTWSDEVYRMFGVDHNTFEATYETFMICVHSEDRDFVSQAYSQSLEVGGDPYEIEHRITRQDSGEVRIVLEKCEHIKDEAGNVIRSIGMVQDITERKKTQQAILDSERKFREVVAQATDGIMMADQQGTIIEWNNRLAEITGMSRDEVLGKPIWQVQAIMAYEGEGPAEFEVNREEAVRQILKSSQSEYYGMSFERRIKRVDGTIRFVETALYPISSGDETMIVSVVRDITERKLTDEETKRLTDHIRDQAAEMEQILETVPAGVVLLNAEGVIQQANPVAEGDLMELANAQVGDRLTRLGSRPLYEILSPPPSGLWHEIEYRNRVFEVIARPMEERTEEGYWVLVINDVTRDREIRKQLQQQGQLAAVGQLAAGIAHDFNNIIAIIGLYAELGLNKPDLDPKSTERFEMIEQQADRAARLTQQITDFSRSSVLQRQPMDLCEFFEEFGRLIQQTLPENVRIEMHNRVDVCSVNADSTRLQQALLNLVLNARDAMLPNGGGTIQLTMTQPGLSEPVQCITCGQISSGDWIRIEVEDDGSGIEPDVLSHIFEPFFTTKDVGQGTGLGLAQVYGIVKQHDGHIYVESVPGQGTTFTVYLPVSNLDPVVLESYEGTGRVFGRGEKILVVEDSVVLRSALCETLGLLNYQVLEAENGKVALEILGSDPEIDLVLSDLVMPVMGGQAMFREIQKRGFSQPVIMLSGHPMESEMARLKLDGLAGWLQKPPSTDHLAHLVAAVLKGE